MATLMYEWVGPCEKCGTSHDGYPPATLGGSMRCLRAQATAISARMIGGIAIADQVDALQRDIDDRRDATLREVGLID